MLISPLLLWNIYRYGTLYDEQRYVKPYVCVLVFPSLSVNYLLNSFPTIITLKYVKKANCPHSTRLRNTLIFNGWDYWRHFFCHCTSMVRWQPAFLYHSASRSCAGNRAVVAGASIRPDFYWTFGGAPFIHALRLRRTNIRVYQFHNAMNIFCLFRE